MGLEDQFRMYIGAYFGLCEMDEYDLKIYVLKDLENYIKNFIEVNFIPNFNYQEEADKVEQCLSLKRKLQDCLFVLPKVKAPLELMLMIQRKIKSLNTIE